MAGGDNVFYCVVDTRVALGHVCVGYVGDVVGMAFRRDFQLTSRSVRLMHIWPRLDHGKAERELGWQPTPVHDSIRRAAQFFRANRHGGKNR